MNFFGRPWTKWTLSMNVQGLTGNSSKIFIQRYPKIFGRIKTKIYQKGRSIDLGLSWTVSIFVFYVR